MSLSLRPHLIRRFPWHLRCALLGAAGLLSGCGGGAGAVLPDSAEILRFARPTGALQCGPSRLGAADRQQVQAALETAGVRVRALACGDDGRVRITLCGVESGELLVLEAAAERAPAQTREQAAADLTARLAATGFLPWANWPDARTQACPAG